MTFARAAAGPGPVPRDDVRRGRVTDPLSALHGRAGRVVLEKTGPGCASEFWAIAAADPFVTVVSSADGGNTAVLYRDGSIHAVHKHPFGVVRDLVADHSWAAKTPASVVGYCAYDFGRSFECLPSVARDDLPFPACRLALYDHGFSQSPAGWVPFSVALDGDERAARHRLEALDSAISGNSQPTAATAGGRIRSTLSASTYRTAVARIQTYLQAGDAYEVNLTHRLSAPWAEDGESLYRRLRDVSPAPFSAFIACPEGEIASVSPELFMRSIDGEVETRPIKGTRPRSSAPATDARLARELEASAKDHAENIMAVDVARNDLGRVCAYGSVRAPILCRLESHPSVHHLVSAVRGRLRPDSDALDLLAASLPGASVTGAPKIRAMEIIEELEPVRRGPYCGTILRMGLDGKLEASIAIRTAVVCGGWAHYGVGGAVTSDSDPPAELRESWYKASPFVAALQGPRPTSREAAAATDSWAGSTWAS